jgi:hypothetical protein
MKSEREDSDTDDDDDSDASNDKQKKKVSFSEFTTQLSFRDSIGPNKISDIIVFSRFHRGHKNPTFFLRLKSSTPELAKGRGVIRTKFSQRCRAATWKLFLIRRRHATLDELAQETGPKIASLLRKSLFTKERWALRLKLQRLKT